MCIVVRVILLDTAETVRSFPFLFGLRLCRLMGKRFQERCSISPDGSVVGCRVERSSRDWRRDGADDVLAQAEHRLPVLGGLQGAILLASYTLAS